MTTAKAIKLIGKVGTLRTTEGMIVECTIGDVRTVYGKDQVQVSPVAGIGSAWVMLDRITLGGCDDSDNG